MGNLYYNGLQPIPEIRFKRNIASLTEDFDGTDTDNLDSAYKTQEQNGSAFNPWIKGFLVQSHSGDGWVDCLLWEDYLRNGKVVDDDLAVPVYLVEGQWSNERVVKIYYTDAAVTDINIGV